MGASDKGKIAFIGHIRVWVISTGLYLSDDLNLQPVEESLPGGCKAVEEVIELIKETQLWKISDLK